MFSKRPCLFDYMVPLKDSFSRCNLHGYFVDIEGRIFSAWQTQSLGFGKGTRSFVDMNKLRLISPSQHKEGYLAVRLRTGNSNKRTYLVHRLVLDSYSVEIPRGMNVLHINSNKQDNRLLNLRWGSQKENVHQSIREGTFRQTVLQKKGDKA